MGGDPRKHSERVKERKRAHQGKEKKKSIQQEAMCKFLLQAFRPNFLETL